MRLSPIEARQPGAAPRAALQSAASRKDARGLTAVVLALAALAWLLTSAAHTAAAWSHDTLASLTPLARAGEPDWAAFICGQPPSWSATLAVKLQWVAGWALMVLAMMLPPALPLLQAMAKASPRRPHRAALLAGCSFVLAWGAVGVVLLAAGSALAWAGAQRPAWTLAATPALLSGAAAVAAGLYQFTPWKKACLTACRSPKAMVLALWQPDAPDLAALRIGLRYAAVCVGCCWALMLLTLAVGAFALPLMVLVSVAMLLERTVPSVRPLIPAQAALAIATGVLLLAGALPAGFGPMR